MSDSIDGIKGASRRDFLRGAGLAAGSVTLLGPDLPAQAQVPAKTEPAPVTGKPPASGSPAHPIRASEPIEEHIKRLGPLKDLNGTWMGGGFNLISLPDFDNPEGPQPFRLKLNSTREIIEFTQIGGNVPNRGSTGQKDINIFGFTYLQRVTDALSNGAMHIEPGLWLHVPSTVVPAAPATVVRQGSIPHGTSILAQGAVIPTVKGGPLIQPVSSTPFNAAGPITDPTYLAPFGSATLPPGFPEPYLKNPNLALQAAILGQNIVKTEVLLISTKVSGTPLFNGGGVLNIPFLDSNAKVTQMDAIFWIETVEEPDGTKFMQLQYTQTLILSFLNISWPHISVATLVKQ